MVTTICYGIEDNWNSRQEAIDYFEAGVICTEGAERDRYAKILSELMSGYTLATDTEWAIICEEDHTVFATFDSLIDAEIDLTKREEYDRLHGEYKDGFYKIIEW